MVEWKGYIDQPIRMMTLCSWLVGHITRYSSPPAYTSADASPDTSVDVSVGNYIAIIRKSFFYPILKNFRYKQKYIVSIEKRKIHSVSRYRGCIEGRELQLHTNF